MEYQEATLPTISTLKATREYAVIGGVGGELCVVPADKKKAKWSCLVSQDTDNIVTHIATLPEDERTLVVSSNDSLVRLFSLDALRLTRSFRMDWSVNVSPRLARHDGFGRPRPCVRARAWSALSGTPMKASCTTCAATCARASCTAT